MLKLISGLKFFFKFLERLLVEVFVRCVEDLQGELIAILIAPNSDFCLGTLTEDAAKLKVV